MTEVNGLRLAYRGLIAGLAGGYVWAAIAMLLGALAFGDPLRVLRPLALVLMPLAGSPELAFVIGLAAAQAGGALVGMCFAYFFARFFTVRPTLAVAAPAIALVAWGLTTLALGRGASDDRLALEAITLAATLGYGLMLAGRVPVRGEVLRYSGSPST